MWRWTAAFWPSERQGARGRRRRRAPAHERRRDHGDGGHDQEPVALAGSLCVDGKRRLVLALAVREKWYRELPGFVLHRHSSPVRRLDEGTLRLVP